MMTDDQMTPMLITNPVVAPSAVASADAHPHALLASPADELTRIRRDMPRLLIDLSLRLRPGGRPFPLLHFGDTHKVARMKPETVGDAEDWFFIGDLHGDFFALHSLLRHAEATRPGCKVMFLGDRMSPNIAPSLSLPPRTQRAQLRKTHDRLQRRAQFVADVGDELVLRAR